MLIKAKFLIWQVEQTSKALVSVCRGEGTIRISLRAKSSLDALGLNRNEDEPRTRVIKIWYVAWFKEFIWEIIWTFYRLVVVSVRAYWHSSGTWRPSEVGRGAKPPNIWRRKYCSRRQFETAINCFYTSLNPLNILVYRIRYNKKDLPQLSHLWLFHCVSQLQTISQTSVTTQRRVCIFQRPIVLIFKTSSSVALLSHLKKRVNSAFKVNAWEGKSWYVSLSCSRWGVINNTVMLYPSSVGGFMDSSNPSTNGNCYVNGIGYIVIPNYFINPMGYGTYKNAICNPHRAVRYKNEL
jgi:hypothetical protein